MTTTEPAPEPTRERPTEPTRRPHPGVVAAAVVFVVAVIGSGALQLLSQAATGRYERTSTLDMAWRMALAGAGFGLYQSPNNRTMRSTAGRRRSTGQAGATSTGARGNRWTTRKWSCSGYE